MSKSCYILELSVRPGGVRRGEVFVYERLELIKRCLEREFLGGDPADRAYAASLAVASGETIALWVVQGGRLVRGINLRPHLQIRVPGERPITLVEAARRDDAYRARLADGSLIVFTMAWTAIAAEAPPLRGELLQPGELVELEADDEVLAPFDSYLEITDELAYGHEDLEGTSTSKIDPIAVS